MGHSTKAIYAANFGVKKFKVIVLIKLKNVGHPGKARLVTANFDLKRHKITIHCKIGTFTFRRRKR